MLIRNIKEFKKCSRGIKGKRIGKFIAFQLSDNQLGIGFSVCHKEDKYDDELAEIICCTRAHASHKNLIKIPDRIVNDFRLFLMQCKKYFKQPLIYPDFYVWNNLKKEYVLTNVEEFLG